MEHADDGLDWLDRLSPADAAALAELLAISAKQLDDGLGVEFDVEKILADGRVRRAAQARVAAE